MPIAIKMMGNIGIKSLNMEGDVLSLSSINSGISLTNLDCAAVSNPL
jgi:hypothetical protein